MDPVTRELQNIEWSRVFGPTNTLGGQLVAVERQLAKVQEAYPTATQVQPDFPAPYQPWTAPAGPASTTLELVFSLIAMAPFAGVLVTIALLTLCGCLGLEHAAAVDICLWATPVVVAFTMTVLFAANMVAMKRRQRKER